MCVLRIKVNQGYFRPKKEKKTEVHQQNFGVRVGGYWSQVEGQRWKKRIKSKVNGNYSVSLNEYWWYQFLTRSRKVWPKEKSNPFT